MRITCVKKREKLQKIWTTDLIQFETQVNFSSIFNINLETLGFLFIFKKQQDNLNKMNSTYLDVGHINYWKEKAAKIIYCIFSIYHCCKNSTKDAKMTTYHQQQTLISEMDHPDLYPRPSFYTDIVDEIDRITKRQLKQTV